MITSLNSYNASNIIQQTRKLSLSCKTFYPFKGDFRKPQFDSKQARRANRPLDKQFYEEVIKAQRKRKPWGL